jgi:molecular chaperone DnaK (HSP70)
VLLGETEVPVVDLLAAVLNRVAVEARRVADGQPGTVALTYPATWGPPRLRLLHAAAQATGLAPAVALGPLARNGVSG